MKNIFSIKSFWSHLQILFGNVTLVYQIGQVGSSTVAETLVHNKCGGTVFHLHMMAPDLTRAANQLSRDTSHASLKSTLRDHQRKGARIRRLLGIRNRLVRFGLKIPKVKVITGTREIVSWLLSRMFHGYDFYFSSPDRAKAETVAQYLNDYHNGNLSSAQVRRLRCEIREVYARWFDVELKEIFGLDVYQIPFDRNKGYQFYENQRAQVLLIRMENLDQLETALRLFFNAGPIHCVTANKRADTKFGVPYKNVQDRLRLPRRLIEQLHDMKPVKHFYSDAALDRVTAKWSSPLEQVVSSEQQVSLLETSCKEKGETR